MGSSVDGLHIVAFLDLYEAAGVNESLLRTFICRKQTGKFLKLRLYFLVI